MPPIGLTLSGSTLFVGPVPSTAFPPPPPPPVFGGVDVNVVVPLGEVVCVVNALFVPPEIVCVVAELVVPVLAVEWTAARRSRSAPR